MANRNTSEMKRGLPHYYKVHDKLVAMRKDLLKNKDIAPWMLFGLLQRYVKKVITTTEKGEPQIATWYGNAPEVAASMGIMQVCPGEMMIQNGIENVYLSHKTHTPSNTCGLLRVAEATVEFGLTPTPTAIVGMLEPCDGQSTVCEMWQKTPEWKDIPAFALDAPYGNTKEDYEYFADELRRMIAFLEETCGKKFSEKALRKVCKEVDKQYAVWKEISALQAAVPAPMSGFTIAALPSLTQHLIIGDWRTTVFFKIFAMASAGNVKKGIGTVKEERVRCVWLDIPYSEGNEYEKWLNDTYGAVIVGTTFGEGHHYTPIDTTNTDTMLYGIAKRSLADASMIRESRSTVDQFIENVKYMVKFYKADCVIFPGNKGHKDMPASIGFLRDVCRELDVALLELTCDLVDPTYRTLDEVKRTTAEFFEAQGWERIDS